MVERDADRPRVERADDPRVTGKLRTIARVLLAQKSRGIAAQMLTRLEIDDVAVTIAHERAVDDDMHDPPLIETRQRPFAARFRVRSVEEPPPSGIGKRSSNDGRHPFRSAGSQVALDTFAAEFRFYASTLP